MLVLALTACQGSTVSTKKIEYGNILDARLRAECASPAKLPNGGMTQANIERYWKRDRAALVKCKGEKSEIVKTLDNIFKKV